MDVHSDTPLNNRQRKIINRLFGGIEGVTNTGKHAKMRHCSPDTALNGLEDLLNKGIVVRGAGGGRSTNYELRPQEEA